MQPRIGAILESLGSHLGGLPGVFSTPQWGGRAYKLPGPGGRRSKPKLVAFVGCTADGRAIHVSFKLDRERAADAVERYAWLEPHEFRTLAPSGWVTARVTTKRQSAALEKLLAESHALHAPKAQEREEPARDRRGVSSEARRIDRVMETLRAEGWSPQDEERN